MKVLEKRIFILELGVITNKRLWLEQQKFLLMNYPQGHCCYFKYISSRRTTAEGVVKNSSLMLFLMTTSSKFSKLSCVRATHARAPVT
jgi:hypothetical protein